MKKVTCSNCGKIFSRSNGRYNEAIKFGWKQFCTPECLARNRDKRLKFVCENCGKQILRKPSEISPHNYCSHSCAVIVNNKLHPRNSGVIKSCAFCSRDFKSRKKYCSRKCKDLGSTIPESELLKQIKDFVNKNGRIPYKYEIPHYHAFRSRFGTWNKAIVAAGFKPNPVMFAKKYTAKDGDRCDSLAEKIIDDFLSRRKIKHIRNFPYPGNDGFTVDFKIGDFWIEFFGLSGQLKKYDQLKKRKLRLAKKLGINLIKIYPKDLFPINKMPGKLDLLLN